MTAPSDTPAEWVERLLLEAGERRLSVLHTMRPEERDAVLLRMLSDRERFVGVIRKLVHLTADVEQHIDLLAKGAEEAAGVIGEAKPNG